MESHIIRFAQHWALYLFIPLVLIIIIRNKWYKPITYRYSLASLLAAAHKTAGKKYSVIFFLLRFIALFLLIIAIAQPQLVDVRSTVEVEGIDIILALDVSGSMQFRDYEDDQRSRIEVAKEEAVHFVEKRINDAIGLVIFGNDVLSRCPLTHDKKMIETIISELKLGIIDADGTLLSRGLLTAINRLKKSKAKSKIIILLTDGEPSQGDIDPAIALKAAKQLGIKIYTIGIGSDEDQLFIHPVYGPVAKPKINRPLLTIIAEQTGGQFFLARNPQDMRTIYDTINKLETVKYELPIFSKYYDLYAPLLWGAFIVLLLAIILSTVIWRGL